MNATAERPETALAESTGVSNPLTLLQSMIERGADPDALKKMMDLSERWRANQAAEAFWSAFNAAQAEMPAIFKSKKGQHGNYAPFEQLNADIRPIYTKHGFSMSFTEEPGAREGYIRICCDVGHREGHVKRYMGDYPLDGEGAKGGRAGMNAVQATGSTHSYAKRYLAKDIWNLAESDEDNDGETYLSSGQVMAINNAIQALKNAEGAWTATGDALPEKYVPFSVIRFYEVYLAKSLGDFPAAKFDDAMNTLDRKLNLLRKDGAA